MRMRLVSSEVRCAIGLCALSGLVLSCDESTAVMSEGVPANSQGGASVGAYSAGGGSNPDGPGNGSGSSTVNGLNGSSGSGSQSASTAGGQTNVEGFEESGVWVFDDLALNTYELTLPPEAWELLQLNARDEEYTEADLSAGGTRLTRVGLRFKGSLGTLTSCFADDGTRTCDKLSMKVKFDEYLPDQQFHGLKRLVFNSMYWDASQLRERLAYRLFRELGVIAPRAVHARLVVNGEYLGLFSLVEDVDGRFTDDRFVGGDGNLYKEQWPDIDDPSLLTAQLETNKTAPDHAVLQQFHRELDAAYPGAYTNDVPTGDLPPVVARYMDVDQLFAYLAVHRTINDWDGVSAFYCSDGECYNHNYYLYQHEAEPRFTLIPWDLDNTFDLSGPLDDVEGMFEIPDDCSVRRPAFGRTVMPAACDPLFRGLALSERARYVAALDRLLDGPFVLSRMVSWLDAWQAQLEPAVADDTNGPGLSEFSAAVTTLRDNLSVLRERALAERDSQP